MEAAGELRKCQLPAKKKCDAILNVITFSCNLREVSKEIPSGGLIS
jgi:hypothetical protein